MKNNLTLKSLAETKKLGSELANEILKKESEKLLLFFLVAIWGQAKQL